MVIADLQYQEAIIGETSITGGRSRRKRDTVSEVYFDGRIDALGDKVVIDVVFETNAGQGGASLSFTTYASARTHGK